MRLEIDIAEHCQHTDEEIAKSFIEDVEAVKDQLPCGEQMDFPSTFDEFAKDYGFKDKDEVYTNGSELIPVFRVKQWLEHISTTKNDLGVDCISRKAAEDITWQDPSYTDPLNILTEVRDKIRELPSVTPQEPCVNNICDSCHTKGCIFQSGIKRVNCEFYTAQNEPCNDAISRESLLNKLCGYHVDIEKSIFDKLWRVIKDMPSVTPQEPRCKDCKWWKDSDGKYRRGCGAESQCPINTHAVYYGEGYCYMFSPKAESESQESEEV